MTRSKVSYLSEPGIFNHTGIKFFHDCVLPPGTVYAELLEKVQEL
jgi:hypothetical protein